ncbi:hypothetical protein F53441_7027 [Fusarium austroafricanum]|uniref:Uncharacterized protein n=1 Tax=Fusarium austroafricanum TaxID=2364996 RepID=A0A8H4KG76_9HYPO|nr:hypothetical protein F53441_7027 [Fusarium austroafricanum]
MSSNADASDAVGSPTSVVEPQTPNNPGPEDPQTPQIPHSHQVSQAQQSPSVHHQAPQVFQAPQAHPDPHQGTGQQQNAQQQNAQNIPVGQQFPQNQSGMQPGSFVFPQQMNLLYPPQATNLLSHPSSQFNFSSTPQLGHRLLSPQEELESFTQYGNHLAAQMGYQFPSQNGLQSNHQPSYSNNPQQAVQQFLQSQTAQRPHPGLQSQQGRAPTQHQFNQGAPFNNVSGSANALALKNSQRPTPGLVQQHGLFAQQTGVPQMPLQAGRDVCIKEVLEDQDVVTAREPGECVSAHCGLLIGEKMKLHDLLKQYEHVQRLGGTFLPADETYRRFYLTIFQNWDSSMDATESPTLPPRSKSEIQVQIGHLTNDATFGQPEGSTRRNSKARKNATPVYLSLDLDVDGIHWIYKDKNGNRVDTTNIKLLLGLSDAQAKHNVLTHYDTCEKNRICGHNLQLIMEAARRRVRKWAAAGSTNPASLDIDDRAPCLFRLVLASDHFAVQHKKNCDVAKLELQRPKAGYKD